MYLSSKKRRVCHYRPRLMYKPDKDQNSGLWLDETWILWDYRNTKYKNMMIHKSIQTLRENSFQVLDTFFNVQDFKTKPHHSPSRCSANLKNWLETRTMRVEFQCTMCPAGGIFYQVKAVSSLRSGKFPLWFLRCNKYLLYKYNKLQWAAPHQARLIKEEP